MFILMLYSPFLFPFKASKRFEGKSLKSSKEGAQSKI
jgi:hypothetical protein